MMIPVQSVMQIFGDDLDMVAPVKGQITSIKVILNGVEWAIWNKVFGIDFRSLQFVHSVPPFPAVIKVLEPAALILEIIPPFNPISIATHLV
jgi:hypothetical protein